MSYLRVIPRDLFNEANLLKCYGQLYLNLERMGLEACLAEAGTERGFQVEQSQDDGSLSVANIWLALRGQSYRFSRPLNARRPYPFYLNTEDDVIEVFNDDGSFTTEMLAHLEALRP